MQLVAIKHISTQRPVGAVFNEDGSRARILLALGLAKPYEEAPPVVAAAPVEPVETAEPEPAEPDVPTRQQFVRRGRSFPISHKPS